MIVEINVLCYNGLEFEEYIGLDGKRYISKDTTKQYTAGDGNNTIRKAINHLKYNLIPFRTYKKKIDIKQELKGGN